MCYHLFLETDMRLMLLEQNRVEEKIVMPHCRNSPRGAVVPQLVNESIDREEEAKIDAIVANRSQPILANHSFDSIFEEGRAGIAPSPSKNVGREMTKESILRNQSRPILQEDGSFVSSSEHQVRDPRSSTLEKATSFPWSEDDEEAKTMFSTPAIPHSNLGEENGELTSFALLPQRAQMPDIFRTATPSTTPAAAAEVPGYTSIAPPGQQSQFKQDFPRPPGQQSQFKQDFPRAPAPMQMLGQSAYPARGILMNGPYWGHQDRQGYSQQAPGCDGPREGAHYDQFSPGPFPEPRQGDSFDEFSPHDPIPEPQEGAYDRQLKYDPLLVGMRQLHSKHANSSSSGRMPIYGDSQNITRFFHNNQEYNKNPPSDNQADYAANWNFPSHMTFMLPQQNQTSHPSSTGGIFEAAKPDEIANVVPWSDETAKAAPPPDKTATPPSDETAKVAPPSKKKKKVITVVKPLSPYNFFFCDVRDWILRMGDKERAEMSQYLAEQKQKGDAAEKTDISPYLDLKILLSLHGEEHKNRMLVNHWHKDRTKRRKHRKDHGKISFGTLNQACSTLWRTLPKHGKDFYTAVSETDRARYKAEVGDDS